MLRLIDANFDRLGEGLRVLEDIARFILEDADICRQLKNLRRELAKASYPMEQQLLSARRAADDVGAFVKSPREVKGSDLAGLMIANARRVQESLRVLEEFAKLSGAPLAMDPAKFEHARFVIYDLERKLISRLLRKNNAGRLAGLHIVLDTGALKGRDGVEAAVQAIAGGAKVIQLRDKQPSKTDLLETARKLRKVCADHRVLFIINDYLDMTLAADADGLHLGQCDLPVSEARRFLSIDKLIGCSSSSLSEALQAEADGADYVGVGPVYPTQSKGCPVLAGPDVLREIKEKVSLPIVAIGGIDESRVEEVMAAGAYGIAVINAVLGAADIRVATRKLVTRMEKVGVQNE